jgi:hypothetical protein
LAAGVPLTDIDLDDIAGPLYRLPGKEDLGTAGMPPVETGLMDGELAFRQHSGGHTTGPNWPTFLTWADRYIKALSLPHPAGATTSPATPTPP